MRDLYGNQRMDREYVEYLKQRDLEQKRGNVKGKSNMTVQLGGQSIDGLSSNEMNERLIRSDYRAKRNARYEPDSQLKESEVDTQHDVATRTAKVARSNHKEIKLADLLV